jgi:hypothetical protein
VKSSSMWSEVMWSKICKIPCIFEKRWTLRDPEFRWVVAWEVPSLRIRWTSTLCDVHMDVHYGLLQLSKLNGYTACSITNTYPPVPEKFLLNIIDQIYIIFIFKRLRRRLFFAEVLPRPSRTKSCSS